jgi:hypothetical protein
MLRNGTNAAALSIVSEQATRAPPARALKERPMDSGQHSLDPSDQVQPALARIVQDFGIEALSDPALLTGLCADALGDLPREARLIVNASKNRIPELLSQRMTDFGAQTAVTMTATTLCEQESLDPAAATWVVAQLATAMGFGTTQGQPLPPPPVNPQATLDPTVTTGGTQPGGQPGPPYVGQGVPPQGPQPPATVGATPPPVPPPFAPGGQPPLGPPPIGGSPQSDRPWWRNPKIDALIGAAVVVIVVVVVVVILTENSGPKYPYPSDVQAAFLKTCDSGHGGGPAQAQACNCFLGWLQANRPLSEVTNASTATLRADIAAAKSACPTLTFNNTNTNTNTNTNKRNTNTNTNTNKRNTNTNTNTNKRNTNTNTNTNSNTNASEPSVGNRSVLHDVADVTATQSGSNIWFHPATGATAVVA